MNNIHTVCNNIFLSKEHPVDSLPTEEIDNRQCDRDSQTNTSTDGSVAFRFLRITFSQTPSNQRYRRYLHTVTE